MPKVRIRIVPNETLSKEAIRKLREHWGTEPITVYGYNPNGYFIVWDQNIADWGTLNKAYCVPCE